MSDEEKRRQRKLTEQKSAPKPNLLLRELVPSRKVKIFVMPLSVTQDVLRAPVVDVSKLVERPDPDVLEERKITEQMVRAHLWVASYSKRLGSKLDRTVDDQHLRRRVEDALHQHFSEIKRDVAKLWAHQGAQFEYAGLKMWGPSRVVKLEDLAAIVAMTYLNQERSGLDAHFLQSIIGKETTFDHRLDGSAGAGLTQFTPIGMAGVAERAGWVSEQLQSWGHEPLLPQAGRVGGKWLVQVEKTVQVKVGRGRRARLVNKTVRTDPDFSKPLAKGESFVRGSGFSAFMADPVNAIESAMALLIVKGARPGMSREEMRQTAENYNGNNAIQITPEGDSVKVKVRYGQGIRAMKGWLTQADRKNE